MNICRNQAARPRRRIDGGWRIAALWLVLALGGCASTGTDEQNEPSAPPVAFSRSTESVQRAPDNDRGEIIAFLRTYLNDPSGVREARIAAPDKRTLFGQPRYVVCLRYNARDSAGKYGGVSDRMAIFADGRFSSFEENAKSYCADADYKPFPELEKLTR